MACTPAAWIITSARVVIYYRNNIVIVIASMAVLASLLGVLGFATKQLFELEYLIM